MQNIRFEENTSSASKIAEHLLFCDHQFVNDLNALVDISAYSQKLNEKAHRFEAWDGNKLVGLLAIYYNGTRPAFISNMSVDINHTNLGIATELVVKALEKASNEGASAISLEVSRTNNAAHGLYKKFGFKVTNENEKFYTLTFTPERM